MDRAGALRVLQEILKACREEVEIQSVSIDEHTSSSGCIIKISSHLDEEAKSLIKSILGKHNLSMKEDQDAITIFSSAVKPIVESHLEDSVL